MYFSVRRFLQLVSIFIVLTLLVGLASACSAEKKSWIGTRLPSVMSASPAQTREAAGGVLLPATGYPTQTTAPLTEDCLVGSWTMVDLQDTVKDSYTRSQSPLQIQSVEGETRYSFYEDGAMEIVFADVIATMTGAIDGKEIVARNVLVGTATAQYRVNVKNREVVFSTFGGDGIQFATEINGQVLAQGNFPAWRAFSTNLSASSPAIPSAGPTRIIHEAFAVVNCAGDRMQLQAIDPVPGPEVNLRRIGE